jgi:Amt family ammonium transporter
VGPNSLSGTVPETVFFMFQMTFAIITPALIVGAYPERVRFSSVLFFSAVWLMVVYIPVTHWVWGGGWLAEMGVMDFAGGIVVHVTAGISALVFAKCLGSRRGFPTQLRPPHNPGLTMAGAAMLWVGWFGFNAGSALTAGGGAGMAMTVTHISAAAASLSWAAMEWIKFGKPSLIGIVTGMVAGLATVTPASGFIGPMGGLFLGLASGVICQWMTMFIKQKLTIDDSLDVFAVHGVGGILGTICVAFLATSTFQGLGLAEGMTVGSQLWVQVVGVVAVAAWSGIASYIILKISDALFGLRVPEEEEIEGLDITAHGERSYEL